MIAEKGNDVIMAINRITDYIVPSIEGLTPNKVNWSIVKKDLVLLIHDMQVYFTDAYDKEGQLYSNVVKNIIKIRNECKKHGIPVIYSAQPENQTPEQRGLLTDFWGSGIPLGYEKQNIINELKPDGDDIVITKWRYSAFENTNLEDLIKKLGKNQMLITGIYTHIGCLTTSVNASMKNIKSFVISDATCDFSAEKHKAALEYISQLSGMVIDTDMLMNVLHS